MFLARRNNRLIFRIALALLVVVALVPTLSRMLSFAQGVSAPWSIVCSVDPSMHSSPAGDSLAPATDHCPMCSLQMQGWLAATSWALWGLLPAPGNLLPLLFLWVACPLFAWAAAQPRGPPAHA